MNTMSYERLLQLLSALLIEVNTLQRLVQEDKGEASPLLATVRAGLQDLAQTAREALTTARNTAEELPPAELEGATLPEALSRMVEESAERLGISSRIAISGVDEEGQPHVREHVLTPVAERLLILLTREMLYEVEQHTGVRRLRLALTYGEDDVQLTIEDDGSDPRVQAVQAGTQDGLAPPFNTDEQGTRNGHSGPVFMPIIQDLRLRFAQLGGTLEIQTLTERGTRMQARLPYAGHVHNEAPPAVPALPLPLPIAQAQSPDGARADHLRVLIVESQAVTRAGLRRLLESYTGIQVVGEAADGVQAASETVELGPQVVLIDAELPELQYPQADREKERASPLVPSAAQPSKEEQQESVYQRRPNISTVSSLNTLRQIKQLSPDTRILLLANQEREEYLYEALRAGADGYVLKDIAPDELIQAIRTVARGEVLIQPQIAGRLLTRYGRQGRTGRYDTLTTRELEVLRLLARGLRNKEIAARLYVSERTVNFHLANIYQKLGVSGRTEALSKALEQGLIIPSQ